MATIHGTDPSQMRLTGLPTTMGATMFIEEETCTDAELAQAAGDPRERASRAELQAIFADFTAPLGPLLRQLQPDTPVHFSRIEAVQPPVCFRGRVVLIGDAALRSMFEDPTPHYDLGHLWQETEEDSSHSCSCPCTLPTLRL